MNIIKSEHRSLFTDCFSNGQRISVDRNKVYLKEEVIKVPIYIFSKDECHCI